MSYLPLENVDRKILIKKEAQTDERYGFYPDKRPIEDHINYGLTVIDKPPGPTSHQVADYVKKILKASKAGHSGTLDPRVTGVLAVAINNATKVVQTLLPAGKEYVCVMHVHKEVDKNKLIRTIKGFVGNIKQIPPIKSSVRRIERQRSVYYIDILEIKGQDVLFIVGCQAGTYIRKLCHDIGQSLKTGAHMAELRRTKVGHLGEDLAVSLQDLTDAFYYYDKDKNEIFLRKCILPMEKAIEHLPKIWVFDSAIFYLSHGSDLKVPGISKLNDGITKDDLVAVMSLKGELLALGKAEMTSEEMLSNEKGLAVSVHKVFVKDGLYKKI